jgi:hypothetical protein
MTLEERIGRLEKQNRRLIRVLGCGAITVVALSLVAAADLVNIVVRKIEVKNDNLKTQTTLLPNGDVLVGGTLQVGGLDVASAIRELQKQNKDYKRVEERVADLEHSASADHLYVALQSGMVTTSGSDWGLVPGMQLKFSTSGKQTAHALFTAPGTEMFGGTTTVQAGKCHFQLTLDGNSVSAASYTYSDLSRGFNWRNAVLQWAGEIPAGDHTVQVEWMVDHQIPGPLTTGLGVSTRCLTVRLD